MKQLSCHDRAGNPPGLIIGEGWEIRDRDTSKAEPGKSDVTNGVGCKAALWFFEQPANPALGSILVGV